MPTWASRRALTSTVFAIIAASGCDNSASSSHGGTEDGGSHHVDASPDDRGKGDASASHDDAGGSHGGGAGGSTHAGTDGGGGGSADSGSNNDAGASAGSSAIVRTLAYHQVSTFAASPASGHVVIAADGSRIVYTIAPGSEDAATPNQIFVINPDGSGNKQVDSYKTNCFCESLVAVSADGNTVVSTDATQVRIAGSDATLKGSLNFDSNEISNIAISGDGKSVFMLQRRDNHVTGGDPVERGIWTASADGGNHHQLIGPSAIADLVGTTADKVFPFAGCGKSLEFSADGKRGVFAVEVGDMGQFVMTLENGAAHMLKGPVQFVKQVAISSDGNKVAAWTGEQSSDEFVVMNFDGSKSKTITMQAQDSCFAPVTLNADGSRLLLGNRAWLFDTAGGDPVSLYMVTTGDGAAVGGPWHSGAPTFSMTDDAKRFAYWAFDDATVIQIGLLELDPKDLGDAPVVSNPKLSVASIPRDRSVGSIVSCEIGGNTLDHAGETVLLHGVEDTAGSWLAGQHVLRDDGMGSDKTASDGVFTADPITSGDGGEVGPRLVRIKAEAKKGNLRHATAIDVSGLEVK